MTVKELIEALAAFPPEAHVISATLGGGLRLASSPKLRHDMRVHGNGDAHLTLKSRAAASPVCIIMAHPL